MTVRRIQQVALVCAMIAALAVTDSLVRAEEGTPKAEVQVASAYTLGTCPISGGALSADKAVVKEYDGREVKFCCAGCPEKFEGDLAASFAKLDEEVVKQQKAHYALATCPVGGGATDSHGEPFNYVYQNQLVQLCCEGCVKKLEANPAEFLKKVNAAAADAQREAYPVDFCLVTGEKLGDDPMEYVIGNRLVKVCCGGCTKSVKKAPAKYLAMLDAAAAGEKVEKPEGS
jgi:YHS domain-containing protein